MSYYRFTINALLRARHLGNINIATAQQRRRIARWVAPTLREFRRRDKLLGEKPPQPRSQFIEWNLRAELFAFGKRLHEEFQLPLLQTAFTNRSYVRKEQDKQKELGIDVNDNENQMDDNTQLAERGQHIAEEFVQAYLQHELPKVPHEGHEALRNFLLSTSTTANISAQLGTKELILSAEYPPTEETLSKTLLAIIGALEQSSGVQRANLFVRDFICTQLNQRDLLEIWEIADPEKLLQKVCAEQKMGEPEARLIGDCGKNTVLAAYNVGIYCNKDMIGEGFGEDISTAVKTASLGALQHLFSIKDSMRPFDFQIQITPKAQLADK